MKNIWTQVWPDSRLKRTETKREKAYERNLWATKSNVFDTYEEFLEATIQLEEDDTHQKIIADIEEKMRRGVYTRKAVKRVLPQTSFIDLSQYNYCKDS